MLVGTFGCSSLIYSFLGNPLFLAVARQQVMREHVPIQAVLRSVIREHGFRGLFLGCGVSVAGTVLSEMFYYLIIEISKEKLPFQESGRNFCAGLLADGISGPIWTPFAVVSQMQWVAASESGKSLHFVSTIRDIVNREGVRGLFKGTLMSWTMLPLSGLWWVVYEQLKKLCYLQIEASHASGSYLWVPKSIRSRCPECFGSATDNPLAHAFVGSAASVIISTIMNPLWVIRTRLQVQPPPPGARIPSLWILKDLLRHEGCRGLLKGLYTNIALGAAGGFAFGPTYEGTKMFADVSS
jgi:hypothetical protein